MTSAEVKAEYQRIKIEAERNTIQHEGLSFFRCSAWCWIFHDGKSKLYNVIDKSLIATLERKWIEKPK